MSLLITFTSARNVNSRMNQLQKFCWKLFLEFNTVPVHFKIEKSKNGVICTLSSCVPVIWCEVLILVVFPLFDWETCMEWRKCKLFKTLIFCLSLNEYFVNKKLLKIGLFRAFYLNIACALALKWTHEGTLFFMNTNIKS